MKKLIIAALLCSVSIAGELKDRANVFGPQGKYVASAIADIPVWIETSVETPNGNLKVYADSMAQVVTNKGFYVIITTQPREWRVSMNPVGLASSEGVRLAGEKMTGYFKRGDFSGGAIVLSQDLMKLSGMAKPKPTPPVERHYQPPPIVEPKKEDYAWVWWLAGFGCVGIITWGIVSHCMASSAARVAARLSAAQREAAMVRKWESKPSVDSPKRITQPYYHRQVETNTSSDTAKAEKLYDSYTPEQRRRIIEEHHHHHYASSAATDPLMFYLLMSSINNQPHYYAPYTPPPAPVYNPPPRHDPPASSYSPPSESYSPPSSSYDSGSSSSSDSGSSSSDSSGGGGSW